MIPTTTSRSISVIALRIAWPPVETTVRNREAVPGIAYRFP
jgi:hypothetical protein